MQPMFYFHLSALLTIASMSVRARTGGEEYYTAAVYEHRLLDESHGGLKANLARYKRAAELARQQGADIILFPEYGLVPPSETRKETRQKLELVPDPRVETANPCVEINTFKDRPILTALSCMARDNDIAVVANMGALQPCRAEHRGCPRDGVFHLNANVAFGKNGTLLARYFKEHLFYEPGMDLPTNADPQNNPVFETEFGTFAMFICFDMYFEKMARTSRLPEVDAILFSTMWFSSLPFFVSTQWFEAWSRGNDATLLAANIQVPGHALSGSGIFRGKLGPQVLTQNPDGVSKLLVATLPRGRNSKAPWRTQQTAVFENGTFGQVAEIGKDVPKECSFGLLGRLKDPFTEYRCIEEDICNYTLVELKRTEGKVMACNAGMCCHLVYSTSNFGEETFYLGVSNSTNNSTGWQGGAEENCLLVRCEGTGQGRPCSNFPTRSNTLFHEITLTANFTTRYVYPSFLGSSLKPVRTEDWHFSSRHNTSAITLKSERGVALIAATLLGRAYHRDPPYVR